MSKINKQLEKMRNNPRDWRIEELKALADRVGVVYRQPGSSHVTFRTKSGRKLTVPAHKPIKPVYVKLFVDLIDGLGGVI
jgi:hypothetical protein